MQSVSKQTNLQGKKVILRLDLNVPLKNGSITDETRINKIIPIINFLIKEQSKIIIISHVGRPKGKVITDLSLKPICENIEKKMNRKIRLVKEDIFKLEKKYFLAELKSNKKENRPLSDPKVSKIINDQLNFESKIENNTKIIRYLCVGLLLIFTTRSMKI